MNAKKNRMTYLWLLPVLLVALVSGCWFFSGTWVIIYAVDEGDVVETEDFYKFTVDLTTKSVWEDHKDDLHNIEDVAFTFKLVNNGGTDVTAQVYVSDNSTLSDSAAVVDSATIILNGIGVDAGDSLHVTLGDYYDFLLNFEALRDLVEGGVFTAYAIVPDPVHVQFRDVIVVVTFSAGM